MDILIVPGNKHINAIASKKENIMPRVNRFVFMLMVAGVTALSLLITKNGTREIGAAPAPVTVELITTADARTQAGSGGVNFGTGYLFLSTLNGHFVFTQFDLMTLPVDATIVTAELQLNFVSVLTGPNGVEVGRPLAAWDESTLTWNNQPGITWGGPFQTVSANGIYSWDVTSLVNDWQTGALPNYGIALRGNGGDLIAAQSKENGSTPPRLVITYTVPEAEGGRPDLGDAPDSTNHLGLNNIAYSAGAVSGRFPTTWDVPAGQVAGPRHENQTFEGILGSYVSREADADIGMDQDGANNILDGGTDNADNDRGDDGWRNRNIKFFDCRASTLTIRVSKGPTAELGRMYLNVWFDGNRDGDWADVAPCQNASGGPSRSSYEWIVQDYVVDMTAVPAGGYLDFQIDTERVMNAAPAVPHWMRFTLSESRAVPRPNGDYPDGRGPHPDSSPGSFEFGETEDVLQLPPPPGDVGELVLEKRLLGADAPVPYAETVTYQIRLHHEGGTEPIEAQIRDELEYPQHVLPRITGDGRLVYVEATSNSGGASPLSGSIEYAEGVPPQQIVSWEGTIAPDSEVVLTFDVHVHPICASNQKAQTIENAARARPIDGDEITAEASFIALCPGYSADDIGVVWEDPINHPLDVTQLSDIIAFGSIENKHSVPVTLALTAELETNSPDLGTIVLPFVKKIILSPHEIRGIEFPIQLRDLAVEELAVPENLKVIAHLKYCFVVDGPHTFDGRDPVCPDARQYPNLSGVGAPIVFNVHPNDLGDAPDSTNHFGVAMSAYPGIQAQFPTVFDPATGLPQGPKHLYPRPLHLGPQVSREDEADVGPDGDPVNNLMPPANNPDNDRFDDGVNPSLWAFNNCQTASIPVRVLITPQAVNWFQQRVEPAYLNIWLDANRDGDWADGFNCAPNQAEVEHIVIDFPVDVVGLGAGLHIINVPTGLTPWPAQWAQQPFWTRVTLSEEKSNQTLLFANISYSDGRGFANPYRTGETEDYLVFPQGADGAGADAAVALSGDVGWSIASPVGIQAVNKANEQVRFKVDYGNLGSEPARNALLTFEIPPALQGEKPDILRAPGIPAANIEIGDDEIVFVLPHIEQDNFIVLGWSEDVKDGPSEGYQARVQIALNGDLDPDNDQADVTVKPALAEPLVAIRAADKKSWGYAEKTCRHDIELALYGIPGQAVTVFVDGKPVGTQLLGEEPVYYPLINLSKGSHHIYARYGTGSNISSPRDSASGLPAGVVIDVDPSLPIDPLSLSFTDSRGNTTHPSTLGFSFGEVMEGGHFREGEPYEVGIDSCSEELNQRVEMIIAVLIGLLRDDDGDGRYTGSFTYHSITSDAAGSNNLSLVVRSGGADQRFDIRLDSLVQGIIRDADTQQPLADALVTALGLSGTTSTSAIFSALPEEAVGQPNPQKTGIDGSYSFNVAGEVNRIAVELAGYQTYRSWNKDTSSGLLAPSIGLAPELSGTVDATMYITDQGFNPAVVSVEPGSIIEWVNLDLAEHTAAGSSADSGVLEPGQSFRLMLDEPGVYTVEDRANSMNEATIIVEGGNTDGKNQVLLPAVFR